MTIRWERCAFSRATSAKHSWPNGQRVAPRQSRWLTLTCRHSRSVWRGAESRSPLPLSFASCSAHSRSSSTLLAIEPCGHVDQHALVVGHALADPVQAGVVGAALEHGVRRVDAVVVLDRLDQPRQVALDQLVLEREGRGRHHDPAVVEQRRHEVAERLAGAGAGLHQQVAPLDHRRRDGLGHLHLTRPLRPAEILDRRRQHPAERVVVRAGIWHPSTLVAGSDRRSRRSRWSRQARPPVVELDRRPTGARPTGPPSSRTCRVRRRPGASTTSRGTRRRGAWSRGRGGRRGG